MPSENQDLCITFGYDKNTAFTLQNMSSKHRDLYVPFSYETGTGFAFQNMPFEN